MRLISSVARCIPNANRLAERNQTSHKVVGWFAGLGVKIEFTFAAAADPVERQRRHRSWFRLNPQ